VFVAVAPIVPPDGTYSWQFYLVNDGDELIESGIVDEVGCEYGDNSTTAHIGSTFAAIPPGTALAIHRGVDTEMRTTIGGRVIVGGVERTFGAEFSRLYGPQHKTLVPIPILGVMGLLPLTE
jgi:hypothetical protein